jgi:hypothetical protein
MTLLAFLNRAGQKGMPARSGHQNLIRSNAFYYLVSESLKGPCHEIFDLRFIASNNSIWALDPRVKAFLQMTSYSRRYSTMKSIFVVSGVNDVCFFLTCMFFEGMWWLSWLRQLGYTRSRHPPQSPEGR